MNIKDNKLIETILGPSDQFSLPSQIFNAITFSGILISFLAFFVDLAVDLGRREQNFGFGLIVTISFIWLYGQSRESGSHRDLSIYYILLEFVLLLQAWYSQGGIAGLSLMIALHFYITIPMILSGRRKYLVLFTGFLLVTGLFASELVIPDLVRYYTHSRDLLIDSYIFLLLISSGLVVCVSLVMRNHEIQFERINQFNTSLDQSQKALKKKITQHEEARDIIQKNLKEKELLLREIHHRVKNNLQVISSLLILQQYKQQDQKTIEAFGAAGNRIQSIALVHELLYQSDTIAHIEFETYIDQLIHHLFTMYLREKNIEFDIQADHMVLAIEEAIPCGLIVTELVTNSLKYAFDKNQTGQVTISLSHFDNTGYELQVKDNGNGLPQDLDWEEASTLGLTLVRELVEGQLEGTMTLSQSQGTCWVIQWDANAPQNLE